MSHVSNLDVVGVLDLVHVARGQAQDDLGVLGVKAVGGVVDGKVDVGKSRIKVVSFVLPHNCTTVEL